MRFLVALGEPNFNGHWKKKIQEEGRQTNASETV